METLATLTAAEKEAAIAGGVAGAAVSAVAICIFILYIITIIATWKIFKKAGEPGWKCLIPIYNVYVMFKIVNLKGWFWVLFLAGIVLSIVMACDGTANTYTMSDAELQAFNWGAHPATIVALLVYTVIAIWGEIVYAIRTSKAFGHGAGYAIGLLFLQPIFWLILGFGGSKYHKKAVFPSAHHEAAHHAHKKEHDDD